MTDTAQGQRHRAEAEAERPILRAFHRHLDGTWPGWRNYEGRTMYAMLWRAFMAGFRAAPDSDISRQGMAALRQDMAALDRAGVAIVTRLGR
jgi:hypothetical protein